MIYSSMNTEKNNKTVDLSRHTDEALHSLMDAVTAEMAKRANVNSRRRDVLRQLKRLVESEGVSLDVMQAFFESAHSEHEHRTADIEAALEVMPEVLPEVPQVDETAAKNKEELGRKESLNSMFESMLEKDMAEMKP